MISEICVATMKLLEILIKVILTLSYWDYLSITFQEYLTSLILWHFEWLIESFINVNTRTGHYPMYGSTYCTVFHFHNALQTLAIIWWPKVTGFMESQIKFVHGNQLKSNCMRNYYKYEVSDMRPFMSDLWVDFQQLILTNLWNTLQITMHQFVIVALDF